MLCSLMISLVLTWLIELPILYLLGIRTRQDILTGIYANMLTNPPVVFAANLLFVFTPNLAWPLIGVMEFLVVLVEGFIFYRCLQYKQINPWTLALLANVISFETGIVIIFFTI
ncbi:MAG: hypothetical protein J6V32_02260 [Elusimicrobiaceae bacterium]|nr:hypothetical protein [Elusimicrobiaceae bacterium]